MTLPREGVRLKATGEFARVGGEAGPVVPVYLTTLSGASFSYFTYYVDLWTPEDEFVRALLVQDRSRWSPQVFHLLYRPAVRGEQLAGVLRIEDLGPQTPVGSAPRPERVDEVAGPWFEFEASTSVENRASGLAPVSPPVIAPPTDFAPVVSISRAHTSAPLYLPIYYLYLGDNTFGQLMAAGAVTLPNGRRAQISLNDSGTTQATLHNVFCKPTVLDRWFAPNFGARYFPNLNLFWTGCVQIVDLDPAKRFPRTGVRAA